MIDEIEIKFIGFRRPIRVADITYKADISSWKSACDYLSMFEFEYDEGLKAIVSFDWTSMLKDAREDYRIECLNKNGYSKWLASDFEIKNKIIVPCQIESEKTLGKNMESWMIARALYESFLAMNLSSPGSFSFYKCNFLEDEKLGDEKFLYDFDIDSFFFAESWRLSIDEGWPTISYLPLDNVLKYLRSLEINKVSFAKTNMERAICSLLQASRAPLHDTLMIIWLAYCLESLYETPIGQSFSVLLQRIKAALSVSEVESNKIKRKLRKFYDERHKLAHGRAPILHPMHDFDSKEAEKYLLIIQDAAVFVFSIALATIQKCITESWSGLNFYEIIQGRQIEKT